MYNSEDAYEDIKNMYPILKKIQKLVIEFGEKFKKAKQDKGIMDFNDIEHFALEILTKKETNIAEKYKQKYEEILIDEYQDSNLVQETILTSISKGNNTFMVGDVKQSIYKFRQARPELFLEKYENYKHREEQKQGENLKIQLFKNFRSRKNVLDICNIIFDSIMSKKLGDIDYNEQEYLNLGADYPEIEENLKAEMHIIDLKDEENIYKNPEIEENEELENIENAVLEARFVTQKIKEMIDSRIPNNKQRQNHKKNNIQRHSSTA